MKFIRMYVILVAVLTALTTTSWFTGVKPAMESYKENKTVSTKDAIFVAINYISGSVLYSIAPYALATVESLLDRNIHKGECRIKNVVTDGFLVAGETQHEPHLRGYTLDLIPVEYTCPDCYFTKPYWIAKVENGKITEKKFYSSHVNAYLSYAYEYTFLTIQDIKRKLKRS